VVRAETLSAASTSMPRTRVGEPPAVAAILLVSIVGLMHNRSSMLPRS